MTGPILPPGIEEQRIPLNGSPTRVLLRAGSGGPVVVFLHGFPEQSYAWIPVMEHMPAPFTCLAFDQRGFGVSHNPWPDLTGFALPGLVADVAAVVAAFGGSSAHIVGHDWGAAVAYGTGFLRPDLTETLTVLNGVHPIPFQRALAAGGAQSAASQYIPWLRSDGVEAVLRADGFARLRGLFAAHMDMAWLTGDLEALYRREWSRPNALEGMLSWYRASPLRVAEPGKPIPPEELPRLDPDTLRIPMPHHLIWGENDTALLPEAHEGLADLCASLLVSEVAGADHWLHHQKPAEVAALIAGFLQKAPGA
ncbi:MAG: alpha/beta hydrolase [Pseudomonadota bacterium]